MAESDGTTTTPRVDLAAMFDEHVKDEFMLHDAEATMTTMVAEPYVNHVPTMTGGVGRAEVYRFYKHHFIPKWPVDTRVAPISRTVGVDQIVDELLISFTHDIEMDTVLPGVPPTGKYVEIPAVVVVKFEGGKVAHEHIYWDQASVLVQVGLLDPKGLPVAGAEQAVKVLDSSRPANTLMARWAESAAADDV
jgi:carboxymethylenebutenolidase